MAGPFPPLPTILNVMTKEGARLPLEMVDNGLDTRSNHWVTTYRIVGRPDVQSMCPAHYTPAQRLAHDTEMLDRAGIETLSFKVAVTRLRDAQMVASPPAQVTAGALTAAALSADHLASDARALRHAEPTETTPYIPIHAPFTIMRKQIADGLRAMADAIEKGDAP